MKKLATLMALFVISLFAVSLVSAVNDDLVPHNPIPVEINEVQVNGNTVGFEGENVLHVEKGDTVDVQVLLTALESAQDIELEASIRGYEYGDYQSLTDQTHVFDVEAGTMYYKTLSLELPNRLDSADHRLRIRVTDRASDAVDAWVTLRVRPVRHGIDIRDVVFSPGMTVKAGRSLLATVQLENFGQKDEDDVKVTLSLDELGVNAYDFVDVENGGVNTLRKTTEELFVQVPRCAEAGEYTARVTAEFDDFESVSETFTINVLENERCTEDTGRLQLTVGQSQSVAQGQQATFPVALVNMGNSANTYTLDVSAGDWATTSVSQSLVVLQPGQTEVVYAYVTAAGNAPAGEQPVSLTVRGSDGNVLETVSLTANVVESAKKRAGLRNGLEVALIVLVVLLVVIGLIVGFSRLKRDEDANEEETYY